MNESANLNENCHESNDTLIQKTKFSKLCEKHRSVRSLYCIDHVEKDLCVSCFDEDHLNCQIIPMARYESNQQVYENLKEKKERERKNCLEEVDEIEKNCIREIKEKCNNLRKDVNKNFHKIHTELEHSKKLNFKTKNNKKLEELQEYDKNLIKVEMRQLKFECDVKNLKEIQMYKECNVNKAFEDFDQIDHFRKLLAQYGIRSSVEKYTYETTIRVNFAKSSGEKNKHFVYFSPYNNQSSHRAKERIPLLCLKNILQQSPKLYKITLKGDFDWKDEEFSNFLEGLRESKETLKSLKWIYFSLNENQIESLAETISHFSMISSLKILEKNQITIKLIQVVASTAKFLKKLSFLNSDITDENLTEIGRSLANCSFIQSVRLNECNSTELGVCSLLASLKSSSRTLSKLYVKGFIRNDMQKEYFINFLSTLQNLEVLCIAYSEFDLIKIFHNLSRYHSNSLKHLDIMQRLNRDELEALKFLLKDFLKLEVLLVNTPSGIVEPGISELISSEKMKKINIHVEHYKISQIKRREIEVFKAKFKFGRVISHSNQYTLLLGYSENEAR